MIVEVYDPFRSAGAEDTRARSVATTLVENDRRYDELRDDIGVGDSSLREETRGVETELRARINDVERLLAERIDRPGLRMSVLEWSGRLNGVLLLGLLLKLIVFT